MRDQNSSTNFFFPKNSFRSEYLFIFYILFGFIFIIFNQTIAQNNEAIISKLYSTDSLKTPKIIFPSKKNYFTVNTTTPRFKWTNIDSSNGYTIYIFSKISTKSDSGFYSSYYGLIKKNEFIVPEGILIDSTDYILFLRSFNTKSWSTFSDTVYFKLILQNKLKSDKNILLPPPTIISRNSLIMDTTGSSINKYRLAWERENNNSEYQLIIDGINSSGIFGEEYINIVNETSADTIYFFHPDKFKKFKKFRWKLRSNQNGEWSTFSNYFYFSLKDKNEVKEKEKSVFDDILLKVKYTNLIDQIIVAKFNNGEIFFPFLELLTLLQNNHKIDFPKEFVSGKRFDDISTTYKVDFKNKKIILSDDKIEMVKENIVKTDLDYFLTIELIERVLNIDINIDLRQLTATITSPVQLPMLKRLLNEQTVSLYKKRKSANKFLLAYDKKWNYLKGGFLDYSLTSNFIKNQNPYYSLRFGLGGELLGGDFQLFNQNTFFNNKFTNNRFTARWRYVFLNNPYLSNISLGNNNTFGLQSYDYRGIRISNEPIETRRMYGRYNIEELTNPHWKVEVYLNNQLIEIVDADINGKFNFSIPFSYGTTLIELHHFGNNGEYKVERKMYQIPINQLPEGKLDYAINIGQLINRKEGLIQSYAAYGINNWLTTKIGTDIFTDNFNNSTIYNNTIIRFFEGNLLDLTLAPNAYQAISFNSLFSNLTNINFGIKFYQPIRNFNPAKIKNEIDGSIFIPLDFNNNQLSFLLRGRRTTQKNAKSFNIEARTFYNINNFTPSIEFEHFNYSEKRNGYKSSLLNFRFNYSFGYFSKIFTGNIIDSRLKFDLIQNKVESFYASFSTTVWQNYRIQISHTINFNVDYSDIQLRVIFDLPFLRSNTNVSKSSFSQSIFGSVNYYNTYNNVEFHNRGMVGKSAAAFKFYLDENSNNKFDTAETQIPDMDIDINSVGIKTKLNNGETIVNDLQQYTIYNVKLVDKKNKNPLWIPEFKEFSFITDPNQFKEVDIPFYETGEISGKILKKFENKLLPVAGITVIFENILTKKTLKIKTMSDGSFYKYGMIPGNYRISFEKNQLKKLGLKEEVFQKSIKSINNFSDDNEIEIILSKE